MSTPAPTSTPFRPVPIWRRILRVVMMLVVLAVAVGGALFYMEFRRKVESPAYKDALKFVSESEKAKALLGDGIHSVNALGALPSGELNDNDARLNFHVAGAKAAGIVKMQARKIGADWGLTSLQLQTDSAEDLNLTQDYLAADTSGMPKFDPNARKIEVPKIDPQTNGDINIELPELK
ncbi:MAG: cytochrome c oxidase assembly factor Coa1 family protein [Pirellulales bacterium]